MKIAVTGGRGLIGREFLKILPKNYEAVVLCRKHVKNNPGYSDLNFAHIQTDYTVDSLCNIFYSSDAVIHLAAQRLQKINSDNSFKNVLVDYNIFRACESLNISNIVFASSCGVYGRNPDTPWSEDCQPSPENPYSLGKLISEKTADYFNKKGLSIKCLRLAHVLSLGARKEYMLGKFLGNALKGELIELYATEDQKREYIYVKDVARGILAALDKPEVKGVFNFGSGEVISIPKLAELINSIFKNSGQIIKRDVNTSREEFSLMDSGLFYSTFDFQPNWTIQNALIDIYNSVSIKTNSPVQ
jgi:UDP-glucose 4-epimerase